jgi:hypothetical protein
MARRNSNTQIRKKQIRKLKEKNKKRRRGTRNNYSTC